MKSLGDLTLTKSTITVLIINTQDTYGRSCHDGYLNKKMGIFALLYVHNVNYTTTLFF